MSSPYCRMKLGRDAYGRFTVACTYCYWVSDKTFRAKAEAGRWFRRHKHDDPATYSSAMQHALSNLRDAGLIE